MLTPTPPQPSSRCPQKPIILNGHERAIPAVVYNHDGDLLFTSAKDDKPTVWFSENGERLGTFHGHNGAVWCLGVTRDSRILATGSADTTCMLWDVYTGEKLVTLDHHGPVRAVNFDLGDNRLVTVSDPFMAHPAEIRVYNLSKNADGTLNAALQSQRPSVVIGDQPKMTGGYWMPLNKTLLITTDDGSFLIFDPETGEKLYERKAHDKGIGPLTFSKDMTMFITGSRDNWAKLWDTRTLEELKAFETSVPVNGAVISPIKEHVMIGGGQDAMSVTTTSNKSGKFETRFFHMILQEEFGRVAGHFGPVNCLAIAPDGRSYASGAEDGYIRVHNFDDEYFKLHPVQEGHEATD